MSFPDDLSPAEEIQLQRLINAAQTDPHADNSASEPGQVISDGLDAPRAEAPEDLQDAFMEHNWLDSVKGNGEWNGHEFTLSPEQLTRVHAIFTECIAEKLTAEIERLRGAIL